MQSVIAKSALGFACLLMTSAVILHAQAVPDNPKAQTVPDSRLIAAERPEKALSALMTSSAAGAERADVAPEPVALSTPPLAVLSVAAKADRVSPGRKQVLVWRGLVVAEHSAAAFDAWSTRASLESGNGYERNPLMKPFANSGAIYPALQIAPFGFDYLAHRFMRSNNAVLRRAWWVPQAASVTASFWCGTRNLRVANLKR